MISTRIFGRCGNIGRNKVFLRTFTLNTQSASFVQEKRNEYRHPLSETVFDEIVNINPSWLVKDNVVWDNKQGTFKIVFSYPSLDVCPAEGETEKGAILTIYDPDTRTHYLDVLYRKLYGRAGLTDNRKSAWQSNIGKDRERTLELVREMLQKIEDASRGIYSLPLEEEFSDAVNVGSNVAKSDAIH
jgi:hypothetical protein